jgi:hypothetical protein
MKQRERILARLPAVCVLLLGTTATNFALAAKTAPASHHSGRAASTSHGNPVTSRSVPGTSHSAPAPVTPRLRQPPVTPRLPRRRSPHVLSTARLGPPPNLTGVRLILVSRSLTGLTLGRLLKRPIGRNPTSLDHWEVRFGNARARSVS